MHEPRVQRLSEQLAASLLGLTEAEFSSPPGAKQGEAGVTYSYDDAASLGTDPDWRAKAKRLARAIAGERLGGLEYALETIGLEYWRNPELRRAVRTGQGLDKFIVSG